MKKRKPTEKYNLDSLIEFWFPLKDRKSRFMFDLK